MNVRRVRPADRAAVREVVTAAFGRPVIADLVEALGEALGEAPALVADDSAGIVGHVQLSRGWVDAPSRLVEVLVLGPLSVVPGQQRRGIGGRLVTHAVAEAERAGAPLLFLEGAPGYYGRFGFVRASGLGFAAPSVRIPDAAFQVHPLPGYEPWMTGALVYADQFWEYDSVGLRDRFDKG
jgi:putative acetyltransferase